ncbi:MAG: RsmD family RNA methyltransferase [Thaumarchaeota archaeon]|nr:RsmD family RNA methyltransferase [Nitrososphaerota archaeon]
MKNRALVLLSGERTSIPEAEARALFLAYDSDSTFEAPEPRVLLVRTDADPFLVSSRIAFARRVGVLIESPSEVTETIRDKRVRVRNFSLEVAQGRKLVEPGELLRGVPAQIDLIRPDFEFTQVSGMTNYLALTRPLEMLQGWAKRRPRRRAFFHPSAIFPKLSRALVNLSGCKAGDVFLDPFSGTGSLPIEASAVGARVVASDQVRKMVSGSLANMEHFGQEWLGVVRADAFSLPLSRVDAIATDLPYGRASSTRGRPSSGVVKEALAALPLLLSPGGRMVVMHASNEKVLGTKKLAVEEEHDLYVHKRLTRTITVVGRR